MIILMATNTRGEQDSKAAEQCKWQELPAVKALKTELREKKN